VLRDKVSQAPLAGAPYRIENAKGEVVASGITDELGRTSRVHSAKSDKLSLHWGH
jgi:type VI secretion system secreted protein VgrG